MLKAVSAK